MSTHADDSCAGLTSSAEGPEQRRLLSEPDHRVDRLADVFGLLSDPGRLRLLTVLLEGERCVCDLAAATDHSQSGVSHALRLLRAHRVVSVRRVGRRAYYRLDDAHVRLLLDVALAHVGHTGSEAPAAVVA